MILCVAYLDLKKASGLIVCSVHSMQDGWENQYRFRIVEC